MLLLSEAPEEPPQLLVEWWCRGLHCHSGSGAQGCPGALRGALLGPELIFFGVCQGEDSGRGQWTLVSHVLPLLLSGHVIVDYALTPLILVGGRLALAVLRASEGLITRQDLRVVDQSCPRC